MLNITVLLCRIEVVSWKPRTFIYHNFMTDEEAEHIKKLAAPMVSAALAGAGLLHDRN